MFFFFFTIVIILWPLRLELQNLLTALKQMKNCTETHSVNIKDVYWVFWAIKHNCTPNEKKNNKKPIVQPDLPLHTPQLEQIIIIIIIWSQEII